MYNYVLINDILKEKLEKSKPSELLYIQKIVNIINNNYKELNQNRFRNSIDVYQSLKLVYKFLNNLNKEYALYFIDALDNNRIILDYEFETGWSYYDDIDGKVMLIPINHIIRDSSVIVHELMHDLNLEPNHLSITRFLFTESISILGEMLYAAFLIDNNLYVHDVKVNLKDLFWGTSRISMKNDFDIQLMLEFLNDGYVNDKTIKKLLLNKEYNYQINYSLSQLEDSSFGFDMDQRYSIGILFASFMFERIQNNKNNIRELFEINEIINDISFKELMSYLGLETEKKDEFLLTNDSLEKLEKSYKKILKNIG